MVMDTNTKKGFTVLELIVCIIFVGIFVVLFFYQKINADAMERDETRKTALNAMFYSLEEGYREQNGAYPEKIDKAEVLPWMDPNLFTDPYGTPLWEEGSNYSYEGKNCEDGKCKSYELRSVMEREEDFVKTSRN